MTLLNQTYVKAWTILIEVYKQVKITVFNSAHVSPEAENQLGKSSSIPVYSCFSAHTASPTVRLFTSQPQTHQRMNLLNKAHVRHIFWHTVRHPFLPRPTSACELLNPRLSAKTGNGGMTRKKEVKKCMNSLENQVCTWTNMEHCCCGHSYPFTAWHSMNPAQVPVHLLRHLELIIVWRSI